MAEAIIVGVLVGLSTGLISGLGSWWIVARGIRPNLQLSAGVSKLRDDNVGTAWRYRVKMLNVRRPWLPRAPAVEVSATATLRVRGLRPSAPKTWVGIRIPIGYDGEIPYIADDRVLRLRLHDAEPHVLHLLPETVKRAIESREITLEELLALGEEANLDVVISASHGYTNARATVIARYAADDIRCGPFDLKGLEILEDEALCLDEASEQAADADQPTGVVPNTRL